MTPYKIIFIDWHKTLCFDYFWGYWAEPAHALNATFLAMQQAFFADTTKLVIPWMRGELTAEQAVICLASQVGADEALLMRELIASCCAMRIVDPKVPAQIGTLRGMGIRVVLATDNMDTFTRWTVPALELSEMFDDILCSHDLRYLKDDVDDQGRSLFFGPYLAERRIEPGECVLVDDSGSLGAIAERMGMDYRLVCDATNLMDHLKELTGQEETFPSRRCRARC